MPKKGKGKGKPRDLATIKPSDLAVRASDAEMKELSDIAQPRMSAIRVNHGNETFQMPDMGDGEHEADKFRAIILDIVPQKVMYLTEFADREGEGGPPDCMSVAGGEPSASKRKVTYRNKEYTAFGNCSTCPFDEFGSGAGNSKACKEGWTAYVIPEGFTTLCFMRIPITSRDSVAGFIARLRAQRVLPRMVITEFSASRYLKRNTVSVVHLTPVGGVEEDFYEGSVKPMHEALKDYVRQPRLVEDHSAEAPEKVEEPQSKSRKKRGKSEI